MDVSQFDAWTRRRFGLALGGGTASLLGLAAIDHAEAKKKHKHKKKQRCRKGRQGCGGKKKCCKSLTCGTTFYDGPNHCCRLPSTACTVTEECCTGAVCGPTSQVIGPHCCLGPSGPCTKPQDCCAGLLCIANYCDL
jgi:hypothetical protein